MLSLQHVIENGLAFQQGGDRIHAQVGLHHRPSSNVQLVDANSGVGLDDQVAKRGVFGGVFQGELLAIGQENHCS